MTSYSNPWTGKPVDTISDLLPRPNGQTCDECGSPCIDNCIMCGAPQCCPSCCYEDSPSARITGDKDRENPVEGAPLAKEAADRLRLWFFRECNSGTRRQLFSIFGLPLDEIRNEGAERLCFNHILDALTKEPTP